MAKAGIGVLAFHSQAKTFADGIAEWWFHIYDATIRGPIDAVDREQQDPTQTLSDYLATLIPLLDDFIRASPLGQFHARMQLLHSFEVYCVHLAGTQPEFLRDTLNRVRRILHATQSYYSLFSLQVSTKLSDQRNVLEKELRGFIKLASWKDINVQALKASAQRTHHQLYKIIRKFRDVLRQPVSDHLHPQYAGDLERQRLQIHQPLDTWGSLPLPSFPGNDSVPAPSAHLLNLEPTFKRFRDLLHIRIRPFISSCSALIVYNLAVDVIITTKELAAVAVASTPAEKRDKQQKALMVRKRKAWSDLLKELKRAGFSINVKPDVLRQQSDARWIRDANTLDLPNLRIFMSVDPQYGEWFRAMRNKGIEIALSAVESGCLVPSFEPNNHSWYVKQVELEAQSANIGIQLSFIRHGVHQATQKQTNDHSASELVPGDSICVRRRRHDVEERVRGQRFLQAARVRGRGAGDAGSMPVVGSRGRNAADPILVVVGMHGLGGRGGVLVPGLGGGVLVRVRGLGGCGMLVRGLGG